METIIREMRAADYEAAELLWRASEGIGLSEADQPERIAAYLRRNPGLSFVALLGEGIVGAVLCGHDGRRGYLHHLAVDPSLRRQGIGTLLVNRCLDALAREGIDKAHIFVFRNNQAGTAFWERRGFSGRPELEVMSLRFR